MLQLQLTRPNHSALHAAASPAVEVSRTRCTAATRWEESSRPAGLHDM